MQIVKVKPVSPRTLTTILLLVVSLLTVASLTGQIVKYATGHPDVYGLVPLFYVDFEQNVPTWYSSMALLLAAGLLAVVARSQPPHDSFHRHWWGLSGLFLLLSIDEASGMHELLIRPMREMVHIEGTLNCPWVIPGTIFVALVGAIYLRFLWHLPQRTKRQFLLAGAVYVGGAIGVEILSGFQAAWTGEESFAFALIVSVEEFLEMLGVVLFIHGIACFHAETVQEIRIGPNVNAPSESNAVSPADELLTEAERLAEEIADGSDESSVSSRPWKVGV